MNTQEEAGETVSQSGRHFAPSQQALNAAVNAVELESLKSLEVRENTGSIGRTPVGRMTRIFCPCPPQEESLQVAPAPDQNSRLQKLC